MTQVADGDVLRAAHIDFAEMRAAIRTVGAEFASLVADLGEDDARAPVPGLTWTVAETAAHMLAILKRGTGDGRRADTLAGLGELNDVTIAEIATRSPAGLSAAIAEEVATLVGLLDGMDAETSAAIVLKLHAGVRTDVPTGLSYILFDLLVHGHEIAGATGAPWPIDRQHAALDLHAALPIFEPWVKREVLAEAPQHLAITFPGDPLAVVIDVGDGSYRAQNHSVADAGGDRVEIDPVEALLSVSRRQPATSAGAKRLASLFEPI